MTARDVLTFKYLGSDYQHKTSKKKEKKKQTCSENGAYQTLWIIPENTVAKKKKFGEGSLAGSVVGCVTL